MKDSCHWAKPQKKTRKKINISQGILVKLLAVLFLGVVVYCFLFADFLKITQIDVVGIATIEENEIQEYIQSGLSGKYLKIIPKNNILFINKKRFNQSLKTEFKKIEEIKTEKFFPDKISIEIKERELMLTLCSHGNCFFVDKNGYAYANADFESEEAKQNNLVKLIDASGKDVAFGEQVLRRDFLEFIFGIANEMENTANVEITSEYRTNSLISEEVIVQTVKGWDIYLSSTFPAEKSARILKTLLNKQINLQEANELEYVDLRSENKAFFRMKGDGAKEEGAEDEILEAEKVAGEKDENEEGVE